MRQDGDAGLLRFARRFDRLDRPIEVTPEEMRTSAARVPAGVRQAIGRAARNIARVAFRQIPKHWDLELAAGVRVEQRVEPLASVGCYVPGGRFPLPSSLLMTAVPARVAGVAEVIVVVSTAGSGGDGRRPRSEGDAAFPDWRCARHCRSGVRDGDRAARGQDRRAGQSLRRRGARRASRDCAIDFFAGPTEIVIVAGSGRPDWIAADLVAQAEHDPEARAVFITWKRSLAAGVAKAAAARAGGREIVRRSLPRTG